MKFKRKTQLDFYFLFYHMEAKNGRERESEREKVIGRKIFAPNFDRMYDET